MSVIDRARELRAVIEANAEAMNDTEALDAVELFPAWSGGGVAYAIDQRVRYDGALYRCIQPHTSQTGWNPVDAPSLFAKVLIPDASTIPAWEQPDSTNPYSKGDRVSHNGSTWVSDINGNVWEPGVYGWSVVNK